MSATMSRATASIRTRKPASQPSGMNLPSSTRAGTGLSALTPAQEVELYRIVPPERVAEMKKSGKYNYYRLGIAPNGVWHYFLQ